MGDGCIDHTWRTVLMAWARVDDAWWSHPKVLDLSMPARGLWVTALSWSCHQRRDTVPDRFVAMVGADPDLACELETAGLWVRNGSGWVIHNWGDYQDRSLSEKRAEAGRKGGLTRASQANRKQNGLPEQANSQAGPSHPIPTHPPLSKVIHNASVLLAKQRGWRSHKAATTAFTDDGTIQRLTELAERFPHAPADHLAQMIDNGPLYARYIEEEEQP